MPRIMYDWLADAAAGGATVVTSSRRLARDLRQRHAVSCLERGALAWQTPDILYWQDWLVRTFEAAAEADTPLLISTYASSWLWERCLQRTSPPDVLSSAAVLRHARQAWQRLNEWRLELPEVARTAGNPDERWFARAAGSYAARLRASHWIDITQLPADLAARLGNGRMRAPEQIICAGFDRLVPAADHLLESLRGSSCTVTVHGSAADDRTPGATVAYADAAAEWRAAGADARRRLQADPGVRVAIIAPDLDARAATIAHLVREGLTPGWQLTSGAYRSALDVSLGQKLNDVPLIAVALLCLQWADREISGSELSILLRTSYLGNDDLHGSSRLERFLRSLPDRDWSVEAWLAACHGSRVREDGAAWQLRVRALMELRALARKPASPAVWARRFDESLTALGWPGIESPDSEEFQLINRWRQTLNDLAQLAVVQSSMTLSAALTQLSGIAADSIFQAAARPGAVHLLGIHEAAGMQFEHVWIGGLDAKRWPPRSRPLALISRRLQRAANMPDATPAETLAFAKQVLAARRASAASVTLSWPCADEHAAVAPSPLLDCSLPATLASDDPGWFAATLATPLRELDDDTGPPVYRGEKVRGGAYTIQRQHEDPFAAFAIGRLGVRELERLQRGLSARHRGIALHRALQQLYADRPARNDIAGWSAREREARIVAAVNRSLHDLRRHADDVLQRLLVFERYRMQALLHEFLDQEARREDFCVHDVEAQLAHSRGNVTLELRIDRIDRLADGSLLVVDYKSGRERPLQTQDGDLASWQLGVYARALEETVGGLLLISLDSRAIAYRGVGGSVPWGRVDSDAWPAQCARWMQRVDELLGALAAGDLRVNLRLPLAQTRALSILSRIEELRRAG